MVVCTSLEKDTLRYHPNTWVKNMKLLFYTSSHVGIAHSYCHHNSVPTADLAAQTGAQGNCRQQTQSYARHPAVISPMNWTFRKMTDN